MNIGYALGIFVLGMVFGIPFSKWGRKSFGKRKMGSDALIENPSALARAEADLKRQANSWVLARTFNSIDGFSEPYIVDLTMKLQAEGFHVSYDSHASVGGNMRTYMLRCPAEELTKLHAALDRGH